VIITGSQLPLSDEKNDAFVNIMGCFRVLANFVVPEVCVYFQDHLMRGNRVKKIDSCQLNAFNSLTFPSLVEDNVFLKARWDIIRKPPTKSEKFSINTSLSDDFVVFPVDSTLNWEVLLDVLQEKKYRAVILKFQDRSYQSLQYYTGLFSKLVKMDIIVFVCSQSQRGGSKNQSVLDWLKSQGVAFGYDITTAAAHGKMAHLLGQTGLSKEDVTSKLGQDLKGEVTLDFEITYVKPPANSFITRLADLVLRKTGDDFDFIKKNTLNMLENLLVNYNCTEAIKMVMNMEENVREYESRDVIKSTVLHEIARAGNTELMRVLLVDCKLDFDHLDIYGRNPMYEALENGNKEAVLMLTEHGYSAKADHSLVTLKMHKFAKDNDTDN
jgi:lysophospholipase